MLKGHTKIELTDVRTGKKTVREHDNLVTGAAERHLNCILPVNSGYRMTPLHEYAMGGIMLFGNSLLVPDGGTSDYTFPFSASLTGYASNDANNTQDKKRGSRNLTESKELDNGYQFVWDFTTDQANGDIAAVALTSADAGKDPFKDEIVQILSFSNITGNLCDFDFSTMTATFFVQSGKNIKLHRYHVGLLNIDVNDTMGTLRKIKEEDVNLADFNVSNPGNYVVKKSGGHFYFSYRYNNQICMSRFSADTLKYDSDYGIRNTGITTYSSVTDFCIVEGNAYISTGGLYRCDISGTAPAEKIDTPSNANFIYLARYDSSTIISNAYYIVLKDQGAEFITRSGNSNLKITKVGADNMAFGTNMSSISMFELKHYLATINNLDSPVEKTANQVMKITYTITHP